MELVELKNAVDQLEVDLDELTKAEQAKEQWRHQDLSRRDGSWAQDERHDRMGQEADDRVRQAKQKVNAQKERFINLVNAI